MQADVLRLLTDAPSRKVLGLVAERRAIRRGDLLKAIMPAVEENAFAAAVERLKSAGLISEEEAPIKDWTTLYITADGLEAERKARRLSIK